MRTRNVFHWAGAGLLLALATCGSGDGGAAPATPTTTQSPLEPWILYQGPIPNGKGSHLVRPDGTGDHLATPNVPVVKDGGQAHANWSPDGQQLVYAVDDARDVDANGKPNEVVSRNIWISGYDGSNAEMVFDCFLPCVEADDPAWSPDGKTIAFVAFDNDNYNAVNVRVVLLDVATKQVSTAVVATGSDAFDWPRWSPDGTHLVLEMQHWSNSGADGEMTASAIAVVDLGADHPTPQVITDWDSWATYPDWNPKDDLIVFSTRQWTEFDSGPSNLYTIRPDGSEKTALTKFEKGRTRCSRRGHPMARRSSSPRSRVTGSVIRRWRSSTATVRA